jgi:hypothetical protein
MVCHTALGDAVLLGRILLVCRTALCGVLGVSLDDAFANEWIYEGSSDDMDRHDARRKRH